MRGPGGGGGEGGAAVHEGVYSLGAGGGGGGGGAGLSLMVMLLSLVLGNLTNVEGERFPWQVWIRARCGRGGLPALAIVIGKHACVPS